MAFKIRRYYKASEDWNEITLLQIIPCFNVGWIFDMMTSEKRVNIAFGWLCWIFEWSFLQKKGLRNGN